MPKKETNRFNFNFSLDNQDQSKVVELLNQLSPKKRIEYITKAIMEYEANKILENSDIDMLAKVLAEKLQNKKTSITGNYTGKKRGRKPKSYYSSVSNETNTNTTPHTYQTKLAVVSPEKNVSEEKETEATKKTVLEALTKTKGGENSEVRQQDVSSDDSSLDEAFLQGMQEMLSM